MVLQCPDVPLCCWIQPTSLPKSLFYARGEGRVSGVSLIMPHVLVLFRWSSGVGPGGPTRQIPPKSNVLFVTLLLGMALVWWHMAVEGCCKKYQSQRWNFVSATSFPTKINVFCKDFSHKWVFKAVLQMLLTLSLQKQICDLFHLVNQTSEVVEAVFGRPAGRVQLTNFFSCPNSIFFFHMEAYVWKLEKALLYESVHCLHLGTSQW